MSIRKYGDTSTCLFVAVLIFYKALKYCLAVWPGSNNLKTASIVCEINPDFCKINRMDSLKLSFFFSSAESFMFDVVAVRSEM